jgi:integrase
MICSVFKPSRKKNGKRIRQRLYWGQYRLDGHVKVTRVPLETPDKQVAEERLRKLVVEKQKAAEGLIPSATLRKAAQKPLDQHLDQFMADQEARGNVERYLWDVRRQIRTLITECNWGNVSNITAVSFEEWRSKHKEKSPKTLNDYLAAIRGMILWMCERGMLTIDPLIAVKKVKTNGRQVRLRRALTTDEMRRLMTIADWRLPMYLTAYHTGLRRGELQALTWDDLNLDPSNPSVTIRASTSKNRKKAILPLHRDVVATLRANRPAEALPGEPVFRNLYRMDKFKQDLEAAGIPYKDSQGRYLDFHSFRHTMCTNLANAGVGMRTAMELMRHSDARLTNTVYTDSTQLQTAIAVEKVPSVLDAAPDRVLVPCAQLHAQTSDPAGHDASQAVTVPLCTDTAEVQENNGVMHEETQGVSSSQKEMDGGRYRTRTCNP